ncbi:MAG: outer membrane beta-barrel protein, partial [Sediminibacterium sp.]
YQFTWLAVKAGTTQVLSLGNIYLQNTATMSAVTVTARRPPVVINGDSIEFNSENFKTQPNAVVEDMLKKMPGIEVDKSGGITVNGKSVSKVYVNGKEFFTGDPKMATRNLAADAVDKIQIYDRKSDQAMFTGIDDGNEETAINIKTKKDRKQSTFGKVGSGFGTPGRFDGQGNVNRINNDEQFSVIATANNVNKQNFSMGDIGNFSGGGGGRGGGGVTINFTGGDGGTDANSRGVAETFSLGGNYSNLLNDKKMDFNANANGSDVSRFNTSNSFTQNLIPGNNFNRTSNSVSDSRNQQQRFNATIDNKVSETFSYKFTPSVSVQHNTSNSESSTSTFLPDGTPTNGTLTKSSSVTDATNIANTLLLRKRFAKKGRTISSTITQGYNESLANGSQFTDQLFYNFGVLTKDSILDQQNKRKNLTQSYSANVVYTEPISKKSLLEFNAYLNRSNSSTSRKVFDKNAGNNQYDLLNNRLTNEFSSEYTYAGGGMNYRLNQKKYNFSTGFSLQNAMLNGINTSVNTKIKQEFKDVLPSAMFQYNFSQTQNFNFNYRTSTNQPSLTQLQPVLDQSNINNQTIGNPNLKRTYNHNINLRFFSTKILAQRNFFALLNAQIANNSIVNYDSILPTRQTLSKPVNVNGVYRINASVNYGFGVKKLYSRFNFGLNGGYNNNVNYVNGTLNTTIIKSIGPSLNYTYSLDEIMDLNISARHNYNITKNQVNSALNTNYVSRIYGADLTNYLPWGFVLNQSMNYTINEGRAPGFNTAVPIWNASLSKFFLKNKRAELKLSAFDLLNKNVGISRNVSQNQIVDQSYNVINQYFLIGFTYSLQKSGLGGGRGGARVMTMRMN